ncbi:MAG: PKD domain-containing protein [Candidatus Hydrogenedentes bacterium]|nr:PKD domain-containing protein [Candidatus Hydrogenedentota bacterium]
MKMKDPPATFATLIVTLVILVSPAAYSEAKIVGLMFTEDTTLGQAPLTVTFSDTTIISGLPATGRSWDFGDGSPTDSAQNPSHTYSTPGIYSVTLTVTQDGTPYSTTAPNLIHVGDTNHSPAGPVDLTNAVVVTRSGVLPKAEQKAPVVLKEEIQKRTGISWSVTTTWPSSGTVIALVPQSNTGIGAEGYHLFVEEGGPGPAVVWVIGADARGVLYGAGKLLRSVDWATGSVSLPQAPNVTSAPAYPLRGHQISYTNTSNTCDGWTKADYEQYIRELIIFGANAIENSPLDTSFSLHFTVPQAQMNHDISSICDDYGIAYWVWTPVGFDLNDTTARSQLLSTHLALYQNCVRLDAVFVPGGDPGSNPPDLLLPFIHDLHNQLVGVHPNAGVWVSNQQFSAASNTTFFNYLQTQQPDWIAGVVYGPWTWMTLEEERSRTPSKYPVRHYADITHSVRCQYPVPEWDRALAHTLNREAPNPRPFDEAAIHNRFASLTNGFIAYSEGSHDDVNKDVWLMRGWDPSIAVVGPLAANTNVDAAFTHWTQLESQNPGLATNWRWQFLLLRAYYDKYIKERLANETSLETQATATLANAPALGADTAMANAVAILAQATSAPVRTDLRTRIADLCAALFTSIKYQSSTSAPYFASGLERSCVLDLVDWPVNNRYLYEAECATIAGLSGESAKLAGIQGLIHHEDAGPGGFYDDLGNASKQAHLVQQNAWQDDPGYVQSTQDEFLWHAGATTDPLKGAARLSWQDQGQTLYGQPLQMHYTGLDPRVEYTVSATIFGRFNSVVNTSADGVLLGSNGSSTQAQTYTVPVSATADAVLDLTWELVSGRGCQVSEVWLKTTGYQRTDINQDLAVDAVDVQLVINGALLLDIGGRNADVNRDADVNAVDVQQVINRALGL